MHRQPPEIFLAQVKSIARGPHAPMLHELIFILGNPLHNCPHGPNDGPLGALREIIHHIYLDIKDNRERGSGCAYVQTCISAPEQGCALGDPGGAKVLQFKSRTG